MLKLSVESTIEQAIRKLQSITEAKQLRYSTSQALTRTAYAVQAEVRANMPSRFTIRRPWVLQGIKVNKATPSALTARIYSRDKFMALQETGGIKEALRNHIAVPLQSVRRTKTGIIAKKDRPKNVPNTLTGRGGHMTAIVTLKDGRKFIARLRPKGKLGERGGRLEYLYLLVPKVHIDERLGLVRDGRKVAQERFGLELKRALEENVARAR